MAKVNGPLFSLGASGQLAKALVYAIWKGRPYVREYVVPTNPNSLAQRGTRTTMSYLNERWSAMSQSDKDSWNTLAAADNISAFNAFVKYGLKSLGEGYSPSDNAAEARTAPTVQVDTMTISQTGPTVTGTVNLTGATPSDVTKIVVQLFESTAGYGESIVAYVTPNGTTAVNFEITGLNGSLTYSGQAYSVSETGGVGSQINPV